MGGVTLTLPEKRLDQVYDEMFIGLDGRQSVMVRLDRAERWMKGLSKLFWAVTGLIPIVLADMIVHVLHT